MGCCIKSRQGTIVVGVISLWTSSIQVLLYLVTGVTFEEHIVACRLGAAKDDQGEFPSCEELSDATNRMIGRVFLYLQVLVWCCELISSAMLIASGIKKRSNLMIPWVMASILLQVTLIWRTYQSAINHQYLRMTIQIVEVLVILFFLCVIRKFSKQIRNERLRYSPHTRTDSFSSISVPRCCDCNKPHITPLMGPPPEYTAYSTSKKGPMPSGLGLRV